MPMNVTPNETFLALQAALEAEALSRQQEGQAYYSADAPASLRPPGLRFDLSGQ